MNNEKPKGASPTHEMTAKSKDGGKAQVVMAGWPNQFGGHNVKLRRGWTLVHEDGTVIDSDGFWIDFRPVYERAERTYQKPAVAVQHRKPAPQQQEIGAPDDDGEVPF